MSIPFFAPMYNEHGYSECILSNWLFDFGQSAYKIEPPIQGETCRKVVEIKNSSPSSMLMTIARIAAIVTIALPITILAVIEKFLYCWRFKFQVCNTGSQIMFEQLFSKPSNNQVINKNKCFNHFDLFNKDIRNIIYSHISYSDRFSLLQTEHSMHEDPTLQKELKNHLLTKRIFKIINPMKMDFIFQNSSLIPLKQLKDECLEKLGEIFTPINIERAISIVNSITYDARDPKDIRIRALKKIVAFITKRDIEEALSRAKSLSNATVNLFNRFWNRTNALTKGYHEHLLGAIAISTTNCSNRLKDEKKGLNIYQTIGHEGQESFFQLKKHIKIIMYQTTVECSLSQIIELKFMENSYLQKLSEITNEVINEIANEIHSDKAFFQESIKRISELANKGLETDFEYFKLANTEDCYVHLIKIAQMLMSLNDTKQSLYVLDQAILRLYSDPNEARYYHSAFKIIKQLSKFNLEKALEIADSIKGNAYKNFALQSLINSLASSDPHRAFNLLNSIDYSPGCLSYAPGLNFSLRHNDLCTILKHALLLPKNSETEKLINQIWESIKFDYSNLEEISTWAEMLEIITNLDENNEINFETILNRSKITNNNLPYAAVVTALALKKINPKRSLGLAEAAENFILKLRPSNVTLKEYCLNKEVKMLLTELIKVYASVDPHKALMWSETLDIEKNLMLEICKIILDDIEENALEAVIGDYDKFDFDNF